MSKIRLYIAPSPALNAAKGHLEKMGFSTTQSMEENVTHALLPIPTRALPPELPEGCTVIGGNLPCPGIDLLQDPIYLWKNAAITAHGAIKTAMNALPLCLWDCKCLILGWGRIAQCLAPLLKALGVNVSVAARRKEARAGIYGLGFCPLSLKKLDCQSYRLVFNTVPADLGLAASDFTPGCVKIDLASQKALPGTDVIWARGLPGKETPESSGALISQRVFEYLNKE